MGELAQYQSSGTSLSKWNAAVINVINSTCASPARRVLQRSLLSP